MDLSKDTFQMAIENFKYVEHECVINSLYDFYHDSLLSADKKRYRITREKILEIICKTEENVKEGISIEDIKPFFIKCRLKLRVYNKFFKLVDRHDPPSDSCNNRATYCMQGDGHIYTLNHHLKRLEQHQDDMDDAELELYASADYTINEESKPREAKMIDHIDDIIQIAREVAELNKAAKLAKKKKMMKKPRNEK